MDDNSDGIPEELEDNIESIFNEYNPSADELILLQIQALIEEAEEELMAEYKKADKDDFVDFYDGPYESGPSMLWRLTDQIGIDSDFVTWWFAAVSLNDDGSPFYLVHERLDQIQLNKVELENLPKLADGFRAAEEHNLENMVQRNDQEDDGEGATLPSPSDIQPDQISDEGFEFVIDPEAMQNGEQTIAIRRAPALDQGSLATYVIERRNHPKEGEIPTPIGAFWGHHGGLFQSKIEDAFNRLT